MPELPLAQFCVLRFVADAGQVTARQVAEGLRMGRGDVQNHLRLLAGKDLLDADSSTVPVSYTVTGIACLNGDTAATDLLLYSLYDTDGDLVANTALAGTLAANANTFQSIAFTSVYTITPGRYWVGWQTNGTTTRLETIPASTFVNVLTTSSTGTFGTIEEPTIPTTFTADVGPVALRGPVARHDVRTQRSSNRVSTARGSPLLVSMSCRDRRRWRYVSRLDRL